MDNISGSLFENEARLQAEFCGTDDILFKKSEIANTKLLFVCVDGMCSSLLISREILAPIFESETLPEKPKELLEHLLKNTVSDMETKKLKTFSEAVQSVLNGCLAVFADGADFCLSFGVQGFPKRGIADALTEVDELAAHEAFTESFKDNAALIRKRLHSPKLKIKHFKVGTVSNTNVFLCYLDGTADKDLILDISEKLENSAITNVPTAGCIGELIEGNGLHFFSSCGYSERPDVACAEIGEGRAVIIVDGTPFALIVPFLFSENFQSVDDYSIRPVYAFVARIIKYAAFIVSFMLPGVYVALCTFHQEALPSAMLFDIAVSESITPFPVMLETLFIHFVYEIVREAGIRMPRAVGSAVSIVGGLVIGEAAVSAGLISAPMLIVVALSAITGFVIPKLYRNVALLRFILITLAGFFGFYGITVFAACVFCDICRTQYMNVPISAPFSPFSSGSMRDTLVRRNWRTLGKRSFRIQMMKR